MPHLSTNSRRPCRALPLLLALLLALWTASGQAAGPQTGFPDLALDLDLASATALGLGSGGQARLSRLPAQGLIVVLVSYFCPPCHKEVPHIKDLERRLRERGLSGRIRMLGLAVGDDQALVERFLSRHGGLPFPLLPDPSLAAHKRLGNPVVPTLYAVASQAGKLRLLSLHQGEFMEDPDEFLDALLRALPTSPGPAPAARPK
ncbi:MAG: TlpA family protein disulfide reductase [Proteobacteria bacterium]|nr:TlpA family protein disulfide reductase [Pseudomonadota bacterium]MBU1596150.1 TlpA family protein disulfide reductase [Pseudomonadota bacterium]